MSHSSNIVCPKCLGSVAVRADQAGSRIDCPACGSSLLAPETAVSAGAFDDLFDAPADSSDEVQVDAPPVELLEPEVIPDPPDEDVAMPIVVDDSEPSKNDAGLDDGWVDDLKSISNAAEEFADTESNTGAPANTASESPEKNAEGVDPFDYNPNKSLRVEGISDDVSAADSFYVKCDVCHSKLVAAVDQIGQMVQCGDCRSEIRIVKPKKPRPQNKWQRPASFKPDESEDEFKLEDPVERPKTNYHVDEGFGLDAIQDDLLAPKAEAEDTAPKRKRAPRKQDTPASSDEPRQRKPTASGSAKPTKPAKRTTLAPSSRSQPERIAQSTNAKPIQFSQISELELTQDSDLIIRSAVVTMFLSFAYVLFDGVWNTFLAENLENGEKAVSILPAAFGIFVCVAISVWFLMITISVVMQAVANGYKKVPEWVGFAPSEWMGSFAVVAIGIWASILPGALIGYVASKLIGFIFLPIFMAISCFALMPIFLISALLNQSAFQIFSTTLLNTLANQTDLWMQAYKTFGICLGAFLFGTLVLLIPSLIFSFAGAAIQVVAVTLFAVLLGLHARTIIDVLQAD